MRFAVGSIRIKAIAWIIIVGILLSSSIINVFDYHPLRLAYENTLLEDARARIQVIRRGNITLDFGVGNGSKEVYIHQLTHDFRFGANCFQYDYFQTEALNKKYNESFSALFNYATLPFYWSIYEPTENDYTWEWRLHNMTQWLASFNGSAKGHPIVWQHKEVIPSWLNAKTPAEQNQEVLDHIARVLIQFPEIKTWDLLNEMLHVENSWLGYSAADTWKAALTKARAVRPDGEYIINEYNNVGPGNSSASIGTVGLYYNLIDQIVKEGCPPDAIGFQFHSNTKWQPLQDLIDTFDSFGTFKIPCHVTEFIPASIGFYSGGTRKGVISEQSQAEYAVRIYTMLFSLPSVGAITWWDFSHNSRWSAWLVDEGAYMMDPTGRLLPVYYSLYDLIHVQWNSSTPAFLDSQGKLDFTGFYGNYTITIPDSGTFRFNITDTRPANQRPWQLADLK